MSAKNPGNPGRSIGSWSDKPWSDEDGNDRTVFPFGPFCCLLLLPRHWCRDPLAANKRDNRRGARDESSRVESRGQEIASGEGQSGQGLPLFVVAPHMRPGALTRDHGPPVSDRVSCSGGGTAWPVRVPRIHCRRRIPPALGSLYSSKQASWTDLTMLPLSVPTRIHNDPLSPDPQRMVLILTRTGAAAEEAEGERDGCASYTVCTGIRARHELLVLAFVILEAVAEGRDGTQAFISFHLEPRPRERPRLPCHRVAITSVDLWRRIWGNDRLN
ncbi:hypothetical protein B0J15DRAFT_468507 [Fusarium solani]|uniref:Uncharacterized protein n=1 Tax=Fusarium solani TaxID=169388 RepID=A0A9P9GYS7_FUSSL|nr:uncharacterized protein B0J15DRAFT_468507 [Fusarium solani]KAH7247741.1 hypothetical protein B0J15DRAFT_468507 [Fusarium solani]